ncbi:DNA damage-regulated autophagy modulator protein 2-like isoform X1 [Physella acuta]|uniref:DNA damage-regulated autophagy modulator protein 2-like isoform X1 n=1 Tax=Physella acuta TaxID=109671 RepID=UPI0027DCE308|nr:DNA damage-regulated autophagy modulator protein 2-like isoform X1 [Physella acuta]XP_059139519.1 DNA damage-regulated autophagy modulator protein 2-like isoform X1 [Physella acuta]XP_059139520.1 DNA damage-regulated autophagy modulator protein 2-like isoform X1 [Physella acuta]
MPFLIMILRRRIHYLPILTAFWIISSFFISYATAIIKGHVEIHDFPYISHTAIDAPERCIFAQLVNMGSLMLGVNVYIRYIQMIQLLKLLGAKRKHENINKASLVLGFISAFGLTIVANFQTIVMREVHYTGAVLAFFGGLVYCWMQTSLTLNYDKWSKVAIAQTANSIFLSVCLLLFFISKVVFKILEAQNKGTKWDALRGVYLVSTVSEWLTAVFIVTFVLTYYRDFSRINLKSPKIEFLDENRVLQDYNLPPVENQEV